MLRVFGITSLGFGILFSLNTKPVLVLAEHFGEGGGWGEYCNETG